MYEIEQMDLQLNLYITATFGTTRPYRQVVIDRQSLYRNTLTNYHLSKHWKWLLCKGFLKNSACQIWRGNYLGQNQPFTKFVETTNDFTNLVKMRKHFKTFVKFVDNFTKFLKFANIFMTYIEFVNNFAKSRDSATFVEAANNLTKFSGRRKSFTKFVKLAYSFTKFEGLTNNFREFCKTRKSL